MQYTSVHVRACTQACTHTQHLQKSAATYDPEKHSGVTYAAGDIEDLTEGYWLQGEETSLSPQATSCVVIRPQGIQHQGGDHV